MSGYCTLNLLRSIIQQCLCGEQWIHQVGLIWLETQFFLELFLRDLCMQLSLFHDFEEEVIYGTRKMQVEICLYITKCSVMMFRIQFLARTLITRRLFRFKSSSTSTTQYTILNLPFPSSTFYTILFHSHFDTNWCLFSLSSYMQTMIVVRTCNWMLGRVKGLHSNPEARRERRLSGARLTGSPCKGDSLTLLGRSLKKGWIITLPILTLGRSEKS